MPSAKDIKACEAPEHVKVMVLGSAGTGKSIFASSFPTPAFVFDFDKGIQSYRGLDFDYEQPPISPQGWAVFDKVKRQVIQDVKAGKYKTVVLDSTTSFTDLAMERALMLDPKRSATGGPIWNVHYQMVKNLVEGSIRELMQLPCNFVLISHLNADKNDDGAVIAIKPTLTGSLANTVPTMFDEYYFAVTRAVEGQTRWFLQTSPRGLFDARSRLSGKEHFIPMYIDNNYEALLHHLAIGKSHNAVPTKPKS